MSEYTWAYSIAGLGDPKTGKPLRLMAGEPWMLLPKMPEAGLRCYFSIRTPLDEGYNNSDRVDPVNPVRGNTTFTAANPSSGAFLYASATDVPYFNLTSSVMRSSEEKRALRGSNWTATFIIKNFSSAGNDFFFSQYDPGETGETRTILFYSAGRPSIYILPIPGSLTQLVHPTNMGSVAHLVTFQREGDTYRIRINGGGWVEGVAPGGDICTCETILGGYQSSGNYIAAGSLRVAGFATYDRVLNNDECSSLERALDLAHGTGIMSGTLGADGIYCHHVVKHPRELGRSIDLSGGVMIQSTMPLELSNLKGETGRLVRNFLTSVKPNSFGLLSADIDESDTLVDFEPIDGEPMPGPHRTVYLEREAMLALNEPSDNGDGTFRVTVRRGVFGTQAVAHYSSDLHDREMYLTNTIPSDREVSVYRVDWLSGAEERMRYQGLLEIPDSPDNKGCNTIQVSVRDALGYAANRRLGAGRVKGIFTLRKAQDQFGTIRMSGGIPPGSHEYNAVHGSMDTFPVHRSGVMSDEFGSTRDLVCMKIDKVIAACSLRRPVNSGDPYTVGRVVGAQPVHGEILDLPDEEGKEHIGWEVLTVQPGLTYFVTSTSTLITNENLSTPYWPGDILRGIMCSTGSATWDVDALLPTQGYNGHFDRLPGHWGLAIPDDLIDHDSFERLRKIEPYRSLQMRNFVLGADEEPQLAMDFLNEFCRSWGVFLAVGGDGKIGLRALHNPVTLATRQLRQTSLAKAGYKRARSKPIRELTYEAAARWPDSAHRVTIRHLNFQKRNERRFQSQVNDLVIKGPHFGDPYHPTMDRRTNEALRQIMTYQWILSNDLLPSYTFLVSSDEDDILPGDRLRLYYYGVFNGDESDEDEEAYNIDGHHCLVLDSAMDMASCCLRIELLDLHFISRNTKLVAPTFKVEDATDASNFTIESSFCTMEDLELFPDGDWGLWREGQGVSLYDQNGVLRSSAFAGPINTTTGDVVMGTAFSVVPNVGDLIRPFALDVGGVEGGTWPDDYAYIRAVGDGDADRWME